MVYHKMQWVYHQRELDVEFKKHWVYYKGVASVLIRIVLGVSSGYGWCITGMWWVYQWYNMFIIIYSWVYITYV